MRTGRSVAAFVGAILWVAVAVTPSFAAAEQPPAGTPAPAPTTTPPTTDNTAQTAQATDPEKDKEIVCKKEEAPTGSRIGARKVCKTVAEWRRQQEMAKETMQEIQTRKHEPESN